MDDKYVKLADVKRKLRYILKSYGVGSFVREKIKSALNDLPYSVKGDLETTLEDSDVQPVDRWISCKDKMPEDNTSVLFVYVSENGIRSVHYGYHQTIKGLGSSWAKPSGGWQYCDDDVTYWQPLPEPPKDGDTE